MNSTVELAAGGNEAQVIVDTARASTIPHPVGSDDRFFVVHDASGEATVVDLERERTALLDRPRRKTGTYQVEDAQSLLGYLDKHKTPDTELWADPDAFTITAVINAHGGAEAGHGDHRVILTAAKTPAWLAWEARNRKMLAQVEFAEHIEDRLVDIFSPPAADMLELVQTFTAKRNLAFESSKALSTGQVQLEYRETLEAKAGSKGRLEIPQRFTLRLPPFVGGAPVEMTARLRYRINDGELRLGYFLDRPEDVLEQAFASVIGQVTANATDIPLYAGRTAG